ncbi:uncharacterized protein LOC132990297 [Labrus mixtus]|uniref:uncharacterized protein LOC132990297 n=1 Tax=Labrus mixtus TaxID=508554 RepID=UPI0029C03478|nr:uncharacterized protein LOC132990297 [Labrus mixtus]
MAFCFATFAAALFWLLAAASCAPAGHSLQDACAAVRRSSLELNRQARIVSIEARNGDKSESNFTTTLAWLEAKDMCDPEALKQKSSTCVGKILDVLRSYNSYVEMIAGFPSCSQFANKVKPALHNLLRDMSRCVNSRTGMNQQEETPISTEDTQPPHYWHDATFCHYTLDRLFSFSIVSARVFASGDPARHSDGSAQTCM